MAELDEDQPAEIAIETRVEETGTSIVALAGELDCSNVASLESALEPIAAAHPRRLIFDLSTLRFMDSAGITVLLAAAEMADSLCLRDPSPIVRRVLEITGLSDVLPVES